MAKVKQMQPSRGAITRRRNAGRRLQKRRETPLGRLGTDGASSHRNINRRLLWLAVEWKLDAPPKVGRTASETLMRYCDRHRISYDWMLGGCLKGLKKMVDERRGRDAQTKRFLATYAQLTPEHQAIITAKLNRIIAERDE